MSMEFSNFEGEIVEKFDGPKKVTVLNSPKMSPHELDAKNNKGREEIEFGIKEFLENHPRFKNKDVSLEFFHGGITSLACKVQTEKEKLVLKFSLSGNESEGTFLKEWEDAGVSVPEILEEGHMGHFPYILMSYVDAPVLANSEGGEKTLLERRVFEKMGESMKTMHQREGQGFGRVVDGKAEYENFSDWIMSGRVQEAVRYVEDNNFVGDECGSIDEAIEILKEFMSGKKKSSFCHYDLSVHNVFDTEPLTIFDPDPIMNEGLVDLGRSVVINISAEGSPDVAMQLKAGYTKDGQFIDEKVLQASVLLNAYMKFKRWHKVGKNKNIENVKKYLIENKHLMG